MYTPFMHKAFEAVVEQWPDNTAIDEPSRRVSYDQLNRWSNQLAHQLAQAGTGKGDVVSVMMPSGSGLITALLACFKSGAVYLPVDVAGFAQKRIRQIFTQNAIQTVITSPQLWPDVQRVMHELDITVANVLIWDGTGEESCWLHDGLLTTVDLAELPDTNPVVDLHPDDGNYIFYTSGSTGEGKGFIGCHKGLSHFIQWEKKEFALDASVRVSQLSQLTFDASLRDIFVPLTSGGCLCIPDSDLKNNIPRLIEWLDSARISLIHCVPSLFRLITKELKPVTLPAKNLANLRYVLLAGEALYNKDAYNWQRVTGPHAELVNLYGTSETTLAKTFYRIGEVSDDASQLIPVGKPINDALVAIINDGIPCLIGEIGEIYIKTPYWTKGYVDERLNGDVFVQNPLVKDSVNIVYRTGDLGKYLPDRNIVVLGRTDSQVKVNGIRVELNEIKQAVLSLSGVEEVEVLPFKNRDNDNELICYYTGTDVSEDALRTHLHTELNANLIPAYFLHLPEFPLTINGKVDKKALPRPEQLVIPESDYEAPQSLIECELEAIWKDVLGLSRIGTKLSFFKIGGTSLKAVQVISRVYKKYAVLLRLSDVFTHPTIGQMAQVISQTTQKTYQEIERVAEQADYELSHAQQRLWLADQRSENKILYNMSFAYSLVGKLDPVALRQALMAVVERHESLRTTFVVIDGKPRQKINTAIEVSLEYRDLRCVANPEAEAQRQADEEGTITFDLENGPLLRTKLLQLADEQAVCLFTIHHIIADGWSMQVFYRDVLTAYEAFLQGRKPNWAPLQIQYKEFAYWQNRQLRGNRLQELERYWLTQLGGNLQPVDFPTDFPRHLKKTTEGTIRGFQLNTEQSIALVQLAHSQQVTLFMVALAIVNVLLNRYTGQKDILVGTPVSGREQHDFDNQIGVFVNVLPLRTELRSNEPFVDLLKRVKQITMSAYDHQLYPYDMLVDALGVKTNRSGLPLVNVLVQSQDMVRDQSRSVADLTIEPFAFQHHTSKVDLTFNFFEVNGIVNGSIEYSTALFTTATIDTIIQNLSQLVDTILENPTVSVSSLKLVRSESEEEEFDDFKKLMMNV